MPLTQCNKTYLLAYLDYNNQTAVRSGISKSQYCAYDPNYTEGSCGFINGAPLQIFLPNSSLPNIVGLASMKAGNSCSETQPEILTRIAYYIPWIEANVWPFDRSM